MNRGAMILSCGLLGLVAMIAPIGANAVGGCPPGAYPQISICGPPKVPAAPCCVPTPLFPPPPPLVSPVILGPAPMIRPIPACPPVVKARRPWSGR